jgi:hypothetical protein
MMMMMMMVMVMCLLLVSHLFFMLRPCLHVPNELLLVCICVQVSYLLGKQSYSGLTQSEVSLVLLL